MKQKQILLALIMVAALTVTSGVAMATFDHTDQVVVVADEEDKTSAYALASQSDIFVIDAGDGNELYAPGVAMSSNLAEIHGEDDIVVIGENPSNVATSMKDMEKNGDPIFGSVDQANAADMTELSILVAERATFDSPVDVTIVHPDNDESIVAAIAMNDPTDTILYGGDESYSAELVDVAHSMGAENVSIGSDVPDEIESDFDEDFTVDSFDKTTDDINSETQSWIDDGDRNTSTIVVDDITLATMVAEDHGHGDTALYINDTSPESNVAGVIAEHGSDLAVDSAEVEVRYSSTAGAVAQFTHSNYAQSEEGEEIALPIVEGVSESDGEVEVGIENVGTDSAELVVVEMELDEEPVVESSESIDTSYDNGTLSVEFDSTEGIAAGEYVTFTYEGESSPAEVTDFSHASGSVDEVHTFSTIDISWISPVLDEIEELQEQFNVLIVLALVLLGIGAIAIVYRRVD